MVTRACVATENLHKHIGRWCQCGEHNYGWAMLRNTEVSVKQTIATD